MANITEVGAAACDAIACAIAEALDAYGLDKPAILSPFTGVGIPIADACDGMVWVRVGTVFPTDGTGQQFIAARASWDVPAWCFPIECGVLWCHQNIDEKGSFIDAKVEADYAMRDGAYRFALIEAVQERWRPRTPDKLAEVVMGQAIQPWQPIGPDGGYSGGMFVTNVITSALAICPDPLP